MVALRTQGLRENWDVTTEDERMFRAWLAGFWDGEGTFAASYVKEHTWHKEIAYSTVRPIASLFNTVREPLEAVKLYFDFGWLGQQKQTKSWHKPVFKYAVQGRLAVIVAYVLLPYLRVKRPQAEILANWHWKTVGQKPRLVAGNVKDNIGHAIQMAAHKKLHELNKRGVAG